MLHELTDFRPAQLTRMSLAMKQNISSRPMHVALARFRPTKPRHGRRTHLLQ